MELSSKGPAPSAGTDRYKVLILDPSAEHAVLIVEELRSVNLAATAFQAKREFLGCMEKQPIDLAVMVLFSRSWWQDELRLFCASVRYIQSKNEPEILCILNWRPTDAEEEAMDRISGEALRANVRHEY